MSRQQIRSNQLITTFGPGAMVDLPKKSIIVSGLNKWIYQDDRSCRVEEPRLAAKVARLLKETHSGFKGVSIDLRTPPPSVSGIYQKGAVTPGVTGFVFPHWFIVQKVEVSPQSKHRRRRLVIRQQLEQTTGGFKVDGKSWPVVPVRFVRACRKGHVGDIQWREFAHSGASNCQMDLWMEERGTSGDLTDVRVICECGAGRRLLDAIEPGSLGKCNGSRPWLDDNDGPCKEQNRLLNRTASNAYFPQTLSVISIPNSISRVEAAVMSLWDACLCNVKTQEKLALVRELFPDANEKLAAFSDEDVFAVIQDIRSGKETTSLAKPVKEVEFDALSGAEPGRLTDKPHGDFYACRLDAVRWEDPRLSALDKVVQVHRLREVIALMGFTRFEPESTDVTGELDINVQRAPIVQNPKWMPVSENRGEGVFIQFNTEAMEAWASSDEVRARSKELEESLDKWKKEHPGSKVEFPGAPYIMLHSLAHLLISAISLNCGYPLSSLRERVYAPDVKGRMQGRYGILIFTASAGSEGTLGGLVNAALDIKKHLFHALQLGFLCSNDPVCSCGAAKHNGMDSISGSACHGCLYIAETSCERFNQFLDRSMVVPTLDHRKCGFFNKV